jgi:hypothetical protein
VILTTTHSSHAETDTILAMTHFIPDDFDQAMLKLTIFTTTHSSHAETDVFYHNTCKPCLKLPFLTNSVSSHVQNVFTKCDVFGTVSRHLPIRHLTKDICPETFAQNDICPEDICPERHLPRKTFALMDICPEDVCPEDVCPERHLPRKTFAQKTFAQKDVCPEEFANEGKCHFCFH